MVGKYWGFPGGENITSEIKKIIKKSLAAYSAGRTWD